MGFMFSKLVRWAVFLYILYSGAQYFLRWKSYTFSPKEFRSLASKAHGSSGTNGASATSQLAHELIRTYGVSIVPDPKWTPLVASGLNLKIQLLHSSLTEYIAMFNAPFASSGRSGFHWTNSTCTVLAGQVMRTEDHPKNVANNKETFKAGGNFRHGQFASYVYSFADDTYIACYGRGVVPVSIVWPFAGSLSAGDPGLLFTQVYHFGEATFVNAIAGLQKTFDYYKQKALKTEL